MAILPRAKDLNAVANVSLFALAGILLSRFVAPGHFAIDLLAHWVLQYLMAATLLCLFFLWRRSLTKALIALVATIYFGMLFSAYIKDRPVPEGRYAATLVIAQFNVNYQQKGYDQIRQWFTESAHIRLKDGSERTPDLILLQEATPALVEAMKPLRKQYPYFINRPRRDAYGLHVLSRFPISHNQFFHYTDSLRNYSVIDVKPIPAITVRLLETHTTSPVGNKRFHMRNRELEELSAAANRYRMPTLAIIGDLNISPYSPFYAKLITGSQLRDWPLPGGSWPSPAPFFLRITIDHILIGPHLRITARETGPNLGSDHLPVLTALEVVDTHP